MDTKHTPGPWRVARQNPSPTTGEWMIAGGKPGYLAEIRDCGSGDVTANARLIAAAPELLAALQSIAEHGREFDGLEDYETMVVRMTEKARAAIRKATGDEA